MLSSSLNSLAKHLSKNDFTCLSQEFDTNVLDLVKQKQFHSYEDVSDIEKFKEELSCKQKFHSSLTGKKKLLTKSMNTFLMIEKYLK